MSDKKCPKIARSKVDKLWQLTKIMVDDPSSYKDPYLQGMANGLILALSIFKKWDPRFISLQQDLVGGK